MSLREKDTKKGTDFSLQSTEKSVSDIMTQIAALIDGDQNAPETDKDEKIDEVKDQGKSDKNNKKDKNKPNKKERNQDQD